MRMLIALALYATSVFGEPPPVPVPLPPPQNQIQLLYKSFKDDNHDSQPEAKVNSASSGPKDVEAVRDPVKVNVVTPLNNSDAKNELNSKNQDPNHGPLQLSKNDVPVIKDIPSEPISAQDNKLDPNQKHLDDNKPSNNAPPTSTKSDSKPNDNRRFLQNNENLQQPLNDFSFTENFRLDNYPKDNALLAANQVDNKLNEHQRFLQENYNLQPPQSNSLNSNQKFMHDDGLSKGNVPSASNQVDNKLNEHQRFLQENYNLQPPQSNSLNSNQKFMQDDGLSKGNVPSAANQEDNKLNEHQRFLHENYNLQPPQSSSLNSNQKFMHDDELSKENVPSAANQVDKEEDARRDLFNAQNNYNFQPPVNTDFNQRLDQERLQNNDYYGQLGSQNNNLDFNRLVQAHSESNYKLPPASNTPSNNLDYNQTFKQNSLQSIYYQNPTNQNSPFDFNNSNNQDKSQNYYIQDAPSNDLEFNQRTNNLQSNGYQMPSSYLSNTYDFNNPYGYEYSQNKNYPQPSNNLNNSLDFSQRLNQNNNLQSNNHPVPPNYLSSNLDFNQRINQEINMQSSNYPSSQNYINNLDSNTKFIEDNNVQSNSYQAPQNYLSNSLGFNQRFDQNNLQNSNFLTSQNYPSNSLDFNRRFNQDSQQSNYHPLSNDPVNSKTFNGKSLQGGRRSLLSSPLSNSLNSSHEVVNSPGSGKALPPAEKKKVVGKRPSLRDSPETQPPGESKELKKVDSDSKGKSRRRFMSQPNYVQQIPNNPSTASSQLNASPINTLNSSSSNVSRNNLNSNQMSKYPNLAAALETSEPNETHKKFLSPLLYPSSPYSSPYSPSGLPAQYVPSGLPAQYPPPGLPGQYMPGRLLGCNKISQMIRYNPYNFWRASPMMMSTIPVIASRNIPLPSQFGPNVPSFPNDVEDIETYSVTPGFRSFYPLPRFYDARERYRFMCPSIMQVYDQGCNCRAGWAVAPVSALADRYCIMYNGRIRPELSVHKPLSCCSYCTQGNGCDGGSSLWTWVYLRHTGTVSGSPYGYRQGCQNYKIPPCFGPGGGFVQRPMCVSNGCDSPYANDKNVYRTSKSYAHLNSTVQAIERDIFENGPVTVDMQVYEDFYCYQTGVYKHEVGDLITIQTVKLIGWGEQQGVKYWLATNSWGRNWGEQGFFKILKGFNECGIEQLVIAGLPLRIF